MTIAQEMGPTNKKNIKAWRKRERDKVAEIVEAWAKASIVHVEIRSSEDTTEAGSNENNGR